MATPKTRPPVVLADQFNNISAAVKTELMEKDEEIDCFGLALLTRTNVSTLGGTGQGKTFLTDRWVARIEGTVVFPLTINRHTTATDLFGGYDIAELRATGRQVAELDAREGQPEGLAVPGERSRLLGRTEGALHVAAHASTTLRMNSRR